MEAGRSQAMIEPLRTLFGAGTAAGLGDGALLDQFGSGRVDAAEAAFAALVGRHGPMVRRVCRALLDDPHEADDAFQATFLVLARKARGIRRPELLGSWLYGVAHRAARKLRRQAARRRHHEAREAGMARAGGGSGESVAILREEARLVHEEVARLPERYRAAIVLCDLEGLAHEEVARRHRFSDRTLRRRLARGRDLLRARLVRRGLAPSAGLLAAALAPEPAPAAVPEALTDALARAAGRFAAGGATTGFLTAKAVSLAEGVSKAMTWTKRGGAAVLSGIALAVAGGGVGLRAGLAARPDDLTPAAKPAVKAEARRPSPAEQYQALVRRYQDAVDAYTKAGEKVKTEEERQAVYQLWPKPEDHTPGFLALAERYPDDPVAVDALVWILRQTVASAEGSGARAETTGRAMTILVRDHLGDPRLGPACLELVSYPSPRRDAFLRAVAERSPDRVVRGRATLALALYLKTKGEFLDDLKNPASNNLQEPVLLQIYGPEYLARLRASDPGAILREAAALFDRVRADYGDVPHARDDGKPTRETLADVARRDGRPGPVKNPGAGFQEIDDAMKAGLKAASAAAEEAQKRAGEPGPGEAGLRAWFAAYPKWSETGARMWRLAEENPRSPTAFAALVWLVEQDHGFFQAPTERAEVMARVADALIRDHLDDLAEHLKDRNVAMALNNGEAFPAPHRERIHRALFERGRDRETRGREGLALARYLKASADFVESLALRGADPARRPEVAKFDPPTLRALLATDPRALRDEAVRVLDRVAAEYGDVAYVNGMVVREETLAEIAGRERAEARNLVVGMEAPEILGEDVEGRPMTLSEFRGKVVLLDFGSHEHCGGCRLVYPKLRAYLDRFRGRPFVVLGINNDDRRDGLKEVMARGEITWRCWWDGDKADATGPITTAWNIRGYPTFVLLDHRGVIRSRGDVHPSDARTFDEVVGRLVADAEAASRPAP